MIQLKNVSKFYYSKGVIATGFSKVNLKFEMGEFVAITGESGSGKSTLLNVISGLETYEEGEMFVDGKETSHYLEKDWEIYRRRYIGNIYQNFNLINSYTVYQNIDIILSLNGEKRKNRKKKIITLLKRVDMLKYKNTKVSKLSGGQKQRVAIARALAKEVPVIIADEPTGNLDKKSAESIIELLREISKEKLIIIVTHNYEQVEPYVTRKITMHDGRVLEDKKIKPQEEVRYSLEKYKFKNINIFEEIKLGIRNTFNILPKFILLLLVYSFVVCAIMGEYSFFKEAEYEESKNGYNYVLSDSSDHRVIIKKKDKTSFTREEIDKIRKTDNIESVIENDLTTDTLFEFSTEDQQTWIDGLIRPVKDLNKKGITGRIPKNDHEIFIEIEEDNYLFNSPDEILGKKLYLYDMVQGDIDKSLSYEVVGVRYVENDVFLQHMKIYVSESLEKKVQSLTHKKYSKITIDFIDQIYTSSYYDNYMRIVPNNWVYPGTAFISEDEGYRCEKDNCVGREITITNENLYFTETKSYRIEKTYNKKNLGWILDLPEYNTNDFEMNYNGSIFLNTNDYNEMFNKDTYQMSIYVKNINKINQTVKKLEDDGYKTLMVKDTIIKDPYSQIIRVVKIIVTAIFVFILFFICFFVIRIILKSRNIYFSILRMLGASKRVCLHLLIIELLVVSNLSYFIFLSFAEANRMKYISIDFMKTINDYFQLNDYIILYLIIMGMSLLISLRYSRKLFKDSVMNTYREEV